MLDWINKHLDLLLAGFGGIATGIGFLLAHFRKQLKRIAMLEASVAQHASDSQQFSTDIDQLEVKVRALQDAEIQNAQVRLHMIRTLDSIDERTTQTALDVASIKGELKKR